MNNLIVSDDKIFHINIDKKVVLEKYLEHKFNNEYLVKRVNCIQDIGYDFEFVNNKYYEMIMKVSDYLNVLHNRRYSIRFWERALGLGFYRLLYMSYNAFKNYAELDLNHKNLIFNILDPESYYIPNDFNDMRDFIQYSSFGQEQLFSIYFTTFYTNDKITKITKKYMKTTNINQKKDIKKFIRKLISKKLILKILNKMIHFKFIKKNIKVGIYQSYFSDENFIKLFTRSMLKITTININEIVKIDSKDFDRNSLFNLPVNDKFEIYFMQVIKNCMPKNLIETFDSHISHFEQELKKFPKLELIVNESFIGNHNASFMLAVAKEVYGISHYYNEHNKLNHFYQYNINSIISKLTDKYLTLGWLKKGDSNYVKLASLYSYSEHGIREKNLILYVSTIGFSKASEFANSSFDTSADNVALYILFRNRFFNSIDENMLSEITYKGYPYNSSWDSIWDIDSKIKYKLNQYSGGETAKELMLKSKLVIVDYQSTSHLEALLMDIPTVFFWIIGTYELESQYIKEYDELISCGICQTSPMEAANFVNDLVENDSIEQWWYSEQTQNAKKAFLDRNIGNPEDAIKFYLSLARE